MLKTTALTILLLLSALFAPSKDISAKQQSIQQTMPTTKEGLHEYLAFISYRAITKDSTPLEDITWLIEHQNNYFDSGNIFSKTAYYFELANNYSQSDKHDYAYSYLDSALQLMPSETFPELNLKLLELGEQIADKNRDYTHQIDFLKRIYNSGVISPTSNQLADILLDIADYSWNMHEYDQSMEYCNKALPLVQKQEYWEGKIRALLLLYHNAHFSTNDTTWPHYLEEALKLAEQLDDSTQLSNVFYTIGYSHYRENDQLEAINYYKKARSFRKEKGSQKELAVAIMQQLSYTIVDSIEAVNETSTYIIEHGLKNGFYNVLGNAYRARSWYFAKTGMKDSACYYLNKAFAHRQSLKEKKNASPGFYYALYEVAMLIPDSEMALKYLNLSASETRKISRENNARELGSARAELDYQLQLERIERLTVANNIEHEKSKRQRIALFVILTFSILILVFLLVLRRNHFKLNSSYRELVKKNRQLDRLQDQLRDAESTSKSNGKNYSNGKSIKDEEQLYKNLKLLLEEEKIYRDPNLSIRMLAEKLDTNTTYLSMVINHRFEESFKSILNKYRVNEARLILETKQYANLTIEGIAEKVGYHSRSTFYYNAFKEITGLTPTQYINNLDR